MNPETVHTQAKGDTGESEDLRKAWLLVGGVSERRGSRRRRMAN